MVESECVIPALSVIPGVMTAVVSAPEVVPLFSQPASARTAAIIRIVFIVTPLGLGKHSLLPEWPRYIGEGEAYLRPELCQDEGSCT